MKTPHLATAMLAGAAMIGQESTAIDLPIKYYDHPSLKWEPNGRRRRNKTSVINQRQRRKDRRRAYAAGNRKSFAK